MPDFDSSTFARSVAGQLLRRLADQNASGAPPESLGLGPRDHGVLQDLERLGYVTLERGAGAMAWRIEKVSVTDAGRSKLARE